MTNTQFAVVGKVVNGVVSVMAVADGRVVGYKKPLHSDKPVVKIEEDVNMKITQSTPSFMYRKKQPMVKPVEPVVEVPKFIQDYSEQRRKQQQAEMQQHKSTMYNPPKIYSNWFNKIHDIRE